jgi:hypothetical protein
MFKIVSLVFGLTCYITVSLLVNEIKIINFPLNTANLLNYTHDFTNWLHVSA